MTSTRTRKSRTAAVALAVLVALTATACMNQPAATIYAQVNNERATAGLPDLAAHPTLTAKAQAWADQLADRATTLAHAPGDWYQPANCDYVGENAAMAGQIAWVVPMWMESPTHQANILGALYDSTGVGAAQDTHGRWWVVEVFARCRS